VDPNNNGNPDLPPDHPFDNVQSSTYWSATTDASSAAVAWNVNFANGFVFSADNSFSRVVWCVRGGQGIDGFK
jgi:hypothetical protein